MQAAVEEDVRSVYESLSRQEYSWSELTVRPLPPGVDPARIELYLADASFQVGVYLVRGIGLTAYSYLEFIQLGFNST
jgi:hypothetical protein